ncbi:N-acetylneuraminate synthase family protein [Synechococcus sp. CC9616]|uniref:N-acetylneuraminate synthase family protein n=1 Tax=Synechococcus sp. CC9616 TaxID=110663 RepID=UPI0009073E2A|nr:N-acetylneuraminate synthase family protein [Synechococcus sp. CC9616]
MHIGTSEISYNAPSYFIADIAANHDGSLSRAIDLINLCAEAGANAAKFQNFFADSIVSKLGFSKLKDLDSHQSSWESSVYETYDRASISLDWSSHLKKACDSAGIDYLTAPYDLSILDFLDSYVCAWKVGSGDITWLEMIENLAIRGKPLLLATGASSFDEVKIAFDCAKRLTSEIVLMQCNTNYTGSLSNLRHVNLSVLKTYARYFPEAILGLSDHTPGHSSVLGAITLGARVIEKHFTDDTSRPGPDHPFSMDSTSWTEMVVRSRELEAALGDGVKRVEANEIETNILQRRSLRAACDIPAKTVLDSSLVSALRPCPPDGLPPSHLQRIVGKTTIDAIAKGDLVLLGNLYA